MNESQRGLHIVTNDTDSYRRLVCLSDQFEFARRIGERRDDRIPKRNLNSITDISVNVDQKKIKILRSQDENSLNNIDVHSSILKL